MRRFLILVLVLLLPIQAAVAASLSPSGMADASCEAQHSSRLHVNGSHASQIGSGDCDGAGGHGGCGSCGHHACPHTAMVFIAMPCAAIPIIASAGTVPAAARVAYDSIVLDVPSPPPTLVA